MALDNFQVDSSEIAYAKYLIRELMEELIGEGLEQLHIVEEAEKYLDENSY